MGWDQLLLGSACLAVAMVASVGCSPRPAPTASDVTLRIGMGVGGPEGVNILTQQLFAESLISLGWDGRVVAGLAERWEWQEQGRVLRLQLRPGLAFHDGTPLDAPLVCEFLRRQIEADRLAGQTLAGWQFVKEITPEGDLGVRILLSRPDTFLLSALNESVIFAAGRPDIGTGPFRVASREPFLTVERNPNYHRGTPAIDRVEVRSFDSQRSAWTAMMRGELDMVHEVGRESVDFLKGASRVNTYSSLRPYYLALVFNQNHPVLGRVEVRRALSEAINREQIVERGMRGHGRIADDPIWPHHWAYSAAARRYGYSPDTATLRLEAAGLPVASRPAPDRMASRFRFTCVFWSEDPEFERIALLLQRQLAEVGVDMLLEPATRREISQRAGRNDFDAYLFRLTSGRSFEWTFRFWHSGGPENAALQDTGYSGADATLKRIREAGTESETRTAVADLQRRFYEDAPAVFLAWLQATRAVDARFDVGNPDDPEVYANLWRWTLAGKDQASR